MDKKELIRIIEKAVREKATGLNLRSNELTELPSEIWKLTNLQGLDLSSNQLTELPSEIGQLTNLQVLDLRSNELTELPSEIVQLTKLEELFFVGNPLVSPPPEIVKQGIKSVLAYLQEIHFSRRQWVSKLLIVGEGGVGKTCLLRALQGKKFEPQPTTHGIGIKSLEYIHPTQTVPKPKKQRGAIQKLLKRGRDTSQEHTPVKMYLNTWDFGGQEIYHATHQFFLTDRSLFILVWNARLGYEQGKLYYWLDAIQARAPKSPVLIVATQIDERDAQLPSVELKGRYPQIAGYYEVSNLNGRGIEKLGKAIARIAAGLPLMGVSWPTRWLDAAEFIRNMPERYITPEEMERIMIDKGVGQDKAKILAQWLHDLGDILYFQDDDELNDIVILKPQWVTEYISKVLDSDDVAKNLGIFTHGQMRELWATLEPTMQDHFLRLMERFDLSYRTQEKPEISLVVERLQLDPPDYQTRWEDMKANCREIAMRFRLNTLPAGIPTWFIARSHRFTTHTHWRTGALFAYDGEDKKHLALVQAFAQDHYVDLKVRGPSPHNFFALLKDGIEVTLDRFPGLKIDRMIPCPGHNGKPCQYEFSYADLQNAIEQDPPADQIQCNKTLKFISVSDLLFGIHWRTQPAVIERIDDLATNVILESIADLKTSMKDEFKELRELAQREFTSIYRREQSKIESHCPNVFVLRPVETAGWRQTIIGQKVQLQLYCQAPGCWHPTEKNGLYEINVPADWLMAVGPYIKKMVGMLKYVAPLAGPWVGVALPEYEKLIGNDLKLMNELVKKLPDLKDKAEVGIARSIGEIHDPERMEGSELRAIRKLLDEKDPEEHWGGLKKVLTPEGHYLWLCKHHAEEYAR